MTCTLSSSTASIDIPAAVMAKSVHIPGDYTTIQLSACYHIMVGHSLLPGQHMNSHIDVYRVLELALHLKLTDDQMLHSFRNWLGDMCWKRLKNLEYAYLIHLKATAEFYPGFAALVMDLKKLIRVTQALFTTMGTAVALPEYQSNPKWMRSMLNFFTTVSIKKCWDDDRIDNLVLDRIRLLERERRLVGDVFCMVPYQYEGDDFKYNPPTCQLWSSVAISSIYNGMVKPAVGANTLCDYKTAVKNYKEFVCLDLTTFPKDVAVFAGGSVAGVLAADYRKQVYNKSDADIFVIGRDSTERATNFDAVVDWFNTVRGTRRIYYAVVGSVVSVYIEGIKRKFQIVSADTGCKFDVISKFDLTHIQWCWSPTDQMFYGTPAALEALATRVSKFSNTDRLRADRIMKALSRGYCVFKDEIVIEQHFDITALVDAPNSAATKKMISKFMVSYYPVFDEDLTESQNLLEIFAKIQQDFPNSTVTTDPSEVKKMAQIGGNFGVNYVAVNTEDILAAVGAITIQPKMITHRVQNSMLGKPLTFKIGGEVQSVSHEEDGSIGVKIRLDEPSLVTVKLIESDVYNKYTREKATMALLAGTTVSIMIAKYTVIKSYNSANPLIMDNRGNTLDIKEGLKSGDDIEVVCNVDILTNTHAGQRGNERQFGCRLSPIRLIKKVEYDEATEARNKAATEVSEEALQKAAQMEAVETTYDDAGY